ncbi:MAG: signal transduction histidine kinase/DNA-binding LytR/AlgR family response regulator [Bacteriovoracaceae bacterium]
MFDLNLKIAIIEDDDIDFECQQRLIKNSFFESITLVHFYNYDEISLNELESSDVIIADLNVAGFPDIDSVTKLVRKYPEKPVIVLTGSESEELSLKLVTEGASDFLFKGEAFQNHSTLISRSIVNSVERKKLQNALNEKSRFKSRFLANMSHEIRTPLGVISGLVEVIKEQAIEANLTHHIDLLSSSIDSVMILVNNIVDLSKIEADEIQLSPIHFNPARALEEVSDLLCSTASKKSLNFYYSVEGDIPKEIYLDLHRIKQVLINLVSNAFKFTSDGEVSLNVSFEIDTNRIVYQVIDSGIGIPKKMIDKVFKEFKQLDNSTTRKFGGTGLGLAISKRLIDLMNGSISATSDQGKGTVFTVKIPLSQKRVPDFIDYYDLGLSLKDKSVVVIDDNPGEQAIFKRFLKETEASVVSFSSGQEAIENLTAEKLKEVDYLFIDVKMPILGGVDTFEELKTRSPKLNNKTVFYFPPISRKFDFETMEKIQPKAFYYKPIKKENLISLFNAFSLPEVIKNDNPNIKLKGKVLLAEDFIDNVIVIKEFLKDQEIDLTVVENGKLAYESILENNFDLVLMDIQMAVMDGIEATKKIRTYEIENNLKKNFIVALTANAMKEEVEHYIKIGCNECLIKPVKKANLLKLIKKYLHTEEPVNLQTNYRGEDIPENFLSYIPKYIEGREVDLKHIEKALQEGDFEVIRRICHRILGSAETYGLMTLDYIIKDIHGHAKAESKDDIEEILVKLGAYLS